MRQGINLIEKRLHEMGYWWYPSTEPEVGIDGILEIRDEQTGQMTNLTLQVQSKATERPWPLNFSVYSQSIRHGFRLSPTTP